MIREYQLKEKIIPAFEDAHGAGYQALIIVDNSQGHAAYAADALRVKRMNVSPGGKQARMRDGWYLDANENRVIQAMIFPDNHPTNPNEAKGMKQVLKERGLFRERLRGKCKDYCHPDNAHCCMKKILENQPDFMEQRSLVQEVIEEAGHMCLFLPKFHCELNFIEFFWGSVKRYLREHCDFQFESLKANLPIAMDSVQLSTIRKWEHRVHRWIKAYRDGLDDSEAQKRVKEFSSAKYRSHRRIPERTAALMDHT